VLTLPRLAQERKIKRSELPAAVGQALSKHIEGETIRGFSEEKENAQIFYEAELNINTAEDCEGGTSKQGRKRKDR
jgi:hypothetical protein